MPTTEIFNPDSLAPPGGAYSHVARVPPGATLVVVAGQIAMNVEGELVGVGDFERQCAQTYENVGAALRSAGADWSHVIGFMTFLTRAEDIPRLAAWRQREFPKLFPTGAYPPNTLLVVGALAHPQLLLEVQATAAV